MRDANDGVLILDSRHEAEEVKASGGSSPEEVAAADLALLFMKLGWDAQRLSEEPALSEGQADTLHLEEADRYRLWLSRTGVADGEPYENTITVEEKQGGSWVRVVKYDGGELDEAGDEDRLRGTFTLSIELGNAEMCELEHVAGAVESLAERLKAGDEGGNVYDANGNTVGHFGLEAD
jgi:hypothetical protein